MSYYRVVQDFVTRYPQKATDILVRCCEDRRIYEEITTCLVQPPPQNTTQFGPLDIANTNNAFGSSLSTSPLDSQQSGSPTDRQRHPLRTPPTSRQVRPPSPAPTASSSSKSLSSKDRIENMLILTPTEGSIKEHPVRMKTAPIRYSVIHEDVFERLCLDGAIEIPKEQIALPSPGAPEASVDVLLTSYVDLTWRRPNSNSTHQTTFYLVSRRFLNIDVMISYQDSGKDFQPTVVSQPPRKQGRNFEESIRQPAPTAAIYSCHRSSAMHDGSAYIAPVQSHPILETLFTRQDGAAIGSAGLSQHSQPTTQILGSPLSHAEHSPPHRSTTSQPPSASNVNQTTSTERIRLSCIWGPTPIYFWLNLNGTGEDFFANVEPKLQKRKGLINRATVTIFLKTEREAPADEAYPLSLDEEDLEADWGETIRWLKEHKRAMPPHFFGWIEVDGG